MRQQNLGTSTRKLKSQGTFTRKLQRFLGLAAQLGWAHLLISRYGDLTKIPTSTCQDPGGRHHFTPDDENALYEYENYHFAPALVLT